MKNFGFLLVALLTLVSVATGCSKATVLDDVGVVVVVGVGVGVAVLDWVSGLTSGGRT